MNQEELQTIQRMIRAKMSTSTLPADARAAYDEANEAVEQTEKPGLQFRRDASPRKSVRSILTGSQQKLLLLL
jgi:hypothetical protein